MSLTSKQIDELRAYAKDRKGELAKLINDAADTIEILSSKLHASQMERSSQYYHGGWIPVSERLPEYVEAGDEYPIVIFCTKDDVYTGLYEYGFGGVWWSSSGDFRVDGVIAWMPLPEPYSGEGGM